MSTYTVSREALLDALQRYNMMLDERKRALCAISHSTELIKKSIDSQETDGLDPLLDQRGREIVHYESISIRIGDKLDQLIETAQRCASDPNDEINRTASFLAATNLEHKNIAEKVLLCQQECEEMLKARLQKTAKAIQESKRRRKLDAAYGPAVAHSRQPIFLDRQQ